MPPRFIQSDEPRLQVAKGPEFTYGGESVSAPWRFPSPQGIPSALSIHPVPALAGLRAAPVRYNPILVAIAHPGASSLDEPPIKLAG
jgi:hypothetical protein